MITTAEIYRLLETRRLELGMSQAQASAAINGRRDSAFFQGLRRGSTPSSTRLSVACDALGLEFYIGPPRLGLPRESGARAADSQIGGPPPPLPPELERHTQGLARIVAAAGGDPLPSDLRRCDECGRAERPPASSEPPRARPRLVTADSPPRPALALVAPGRTDDDPDSATDADGDDREPLSFTPGVRLAAGSGDPVWDESDEMAVLVSRSRLTSWARPERLRVVRVTGDSMLPGIRDGDLVAIDPGRTEPAEGQVFGVWTDAGQVVKRLRRIDDRWHVTSDNPAYAPRPMTGDDRILGQVAWTGPPSAKGGGEAYSVKD